jgi:hypothetical protein
MNMIGDPRHCLKALEVGCDVICAQGTEGGGHTGLIPPRAPLTCPHPQHALNARGNRHDASHSNVCGDGPLPRPSTPCASTLAPSNSPLPGARQAQFLRHASGNRRCRLQSSPPSLARRHTPYRLPGGIYNGAGVAAALALGASGVWVGTAFLCSKAGDALALARPPRSPVTRLVMSRSATSRQGTRRLSCRPPRQAIALGSPLTASAATAGHNHPQYSSRHRGAQPSLACPTRSGSTLTLTELEVQRYYSGRTMRVIKNKWVAKWQAKDAEATELLEGGMQPSLHDFGEVRPRARGRAMVR